MTISQLYKHFLNSSGVNIDTRKMEPGCIFFALKGVNFNGSKFTEEALAKGASWVILDEKRYSQNSKCILVEDPLKILQDLAQFHRRSFHIPVIGLTGSNGKTTTKELLRDVLKKKYKVHATEGNLNNHIGVPLTLLNMSKETEIAVIEMGANHMGEIAKLASMAKPTHGLITNIGLAHVGEFGGPEMVKKAKHELYDFLFENGGTVFYHAHDPVLTPLAARFPQDRRITYPTKNNHLELIEGSPFISYLDGAGNRHQTQLIGAYNFSNFAAALCIGEYFGVDSSESHQAVCSYVPSNMRSQIIKKGSNTIILDAYNANPNSMKAGIEALGEVKADNKVVILGDMLELGESSREEHQKLLKILIENDIYNVLLCGQEMKAVQGKGFIHFKTLDQIKSYLAKTSYTNSYIFIKGSRSMNLDKLVDSL